MPIAHCSAMFRKSSVLEVGGYDEQARRSQDYALLLKMKSPKILVLNFPLVFYRYEWPSSLRYIVASDRHGRIVRKKALKGDWNKTYSRVGLPWSAFSDLLSIARWGVSRLKLARNRFSESWLKNATILSFARFFGAGLSAVAYLNLARGVTPDVFGLLSLWIGIMAWLGVVFDLGLTTFINKAISVDKNQQAAQDALRLQRIMTFAFAIILLALTAVFGGSFSAPILLSILLLVLWTMLEKLIEVDSLVLLTSRNARIPTYNLILRRSVGLALFLILQSALNIEVAFAASFFVSGVFGYFHLRSHAKKLQIFNVKSKTIDWKILRKSASYSVTAISLQSRDLESFFISATGGFMAAGHYAAISKFTNPIFMLTSPASTLIMNEVGTRGEAWARKAARRVLSVISVVVCLLLLLIPLSSQIAVTILGSSYQGQGITLVLVASATTIFAGRGPLNAILQSLGYQKFIAASSVIRAFTLLTSISIGSWFGGAVGAASAYLLVMLLDLVFVFSSPALRSTNNRQQQTKR
jgi:O-antigen/teichoic acid export membrane protein